MTTGELLYDIECAITNLWEEYGGYVFLAGILLLVIYFQFPSLYEPWTCKGWSYDFGSSLVDEQIDLIKIQNTIKNGGKVKKYESGDDEYTWLEAKKEQMQCRREVMRQLGLPPKEIDKVLLDPIK